MIERYGTDHPMHSEEIKKRVEQTNLERYGAKNTFQAFKEKSKETNLKKYGTEYAIGSKEVRAKVTETVKDKYGVENPFQAEEIKDKINSINNLFSELTKVFDMELYEGNELLLKRNIQVLSQANIFSFLIHSSPKSYPSFFS